MSSREHPVTAVMKRKPKDSFDNQDIDLLILHSHRPENRAFQKSKREEKVIPAGTGKEFPRISPRITMIVEDLKTKGKNLSKEKLQPKLPPAFTSP